MTFRALQIGVLAIPGLLTMRSFTQETLRPVPVCEILADLKSFNGKQVAVIGRWTSTMEGLWLGEDKCNRTLRTNDHLWDSSLWLQHEPSSELRREIALDQNVLKEKLSLVRLRTKLRPPVAKSIDQWGDAWAVVYGRIEAHEELKTTLALDGKTWYPLGSGHLGAAPAQLVYTPDHITFISEKQAQRLMRTK